MGKRENLAFVKDKDKMPILILKQKAENLRKAP